MNHIIITTPKGKRAIGPFEPAFIVAEISGNHLQSYERAIELIKAAAESGVDAIKLQTYTPDTLTIDCDNEYFKVETQTWSNTTLYKLYESAFTPWDWQPKLKKYAESLGLFFFSTPFDETAVDFLERMEVQLYKIASFETLNIPMLERIGKTRKPVIISRGLNSIEDLRFSIDILKESGTTQIAILHCISSYPATLKEMHLRTIPDLMHRFNTLVGLSDHTLSMTVPLAAISLGACIIEKHFTLSRNEGGPDAAFSLEPQEMKDMVEAVREVEEASKEPNYELSEEEKESRLFQRSIFVIKDIKKGENFTSENIRIIRPGYGLSPKHFKEIVGKKSKLDLKRGIPLEWKYVE